MDALYCATLGQSDKFYFETADLNPTEYILIYIFQILRDNTTVRLLGSHRTILT